MSENDKNRLLDTYFGVMEKIIEADQSEGRRIVAVGPCGLDYSLAIPKFT
jgi:hypothetical protein